MLAESVNEAYRLRSAYQLINSEDGCAGFDTEDIEFVDPARRIEREKELKADEEAVAEFEAELGFSM